MFLNIINKSKKTLKIINDIHLKEGEILNIYGEPYSGKTSLCFYIMKKNINKNCLFVASEILDFNYLDILADIFKKNKMDLYITNVSELWLIIDFIKEMPIDYVIIDSITAVKIDDKKTIEKLYDIIQKKKINAIIVSQTRNYKGKISYGNSKLINFYSYKIKVEKNNDKLILNNKYSLDLNKIWLKGGEK